MTACRSAAVKGPMREAGGDLMGMARDLLFGTTGPRGGKHDGLVQTLIKSTTRTVGNNLGRQILRGVLGSMMGRK